MSAKLSLKKRQQRVAYFFLLPVLVPLIIFFYFPVAATAYLSFTRYNILQPPKWIGIEGYTRLLNNWVFLKSVQNTAVYSLGYIPGTMVLALLLALIVNRKIKGVVVFRTLFYTPVITSMVAASLIWMWLFNIQSGFINYALVNLGIPPQKWLYDPKLALLCVIAVVIWKDVGYNMIIFLAGLQRIPDQLYEAGQIDGANRWNLFWKVTLPLLKPTALFVLVWLLISSFQVFTVIYVMTAGAGGPSHSTTTVVHQIYVHAFKFLKMGEATSMAGILFVVIFVLSVLNIRIFRGAEYY